MGKKGQVTAFVVLGIIIVALIVLLLYLKTDVFKAITQSDSIDSVMSDLRKDIISCIREAGDEPIRRIALQGGYLSTPAGTYRLYEDTAISYLCYNMENRPQCLNRMLRKTDMEKQLDDAISFNLRRCMDLAEFREMKGFELMTPSSWKVDTSVNLDSVKVTVNFPVTLKSEKTGQVLSTDSFTKIFSYPLGELHEVSKDIVDTEAIYGDFDQLPYMLAYHGKYRIQKLRPYPDKIYKIYKEDNNYIFQFAVQGEPL